MPKILKFKSLLPAVGLIYLTGCAAREIQHDGEVRRDGPVSDVRVQTSPEHPDTSASGAFNQGASQNPNQNKPKSQAMLGGSEATAEYHFALAQSYVADGNPDRAIEEFKLVLIYDPHSSLVYTRIATEYIKKGMFTAALEACKEALQRDPKFVDARLMLAGLYSTTRETEQAINEYDKVLKQDPSHEEAIIYKSQILVEDGRASEAVKNLKFFIKKSSESALAHYYLGKAYQKLENFKEATGAYRKAMELRPGFSQAALALGYMFEARKLNKDAIATYKELYDQSQDLSAANRLATLYLKEEKFQEAVPYLESIQGGDPEDMNVRVKLGLVEMELKQYERAIATFKTILKKNPESDRIHYYLGSLYEETHQFDLAIQELKLIPTDSKLFSDSVLHVAYLLKQQNHLAESKSYIEQAIVKAPRVPGFYLFQASLEEEGKNLPRAVALLKNGLKLFPEDEKILYYLGSLYDREGKTDDSLAQMETILKVNPENVDALNYIGYTWTQKGTRLEDAEKLLKRAMVLRPNNGYITDSWGWYLFVRGRTQEAMVQLEKAAQLKPTESTILEHLADVYVRGNLREKALARYQEAVKLTEDETARHKLEGKLDTLRTELARDGRVIPSDGVEREPASNH